MKNKGRDEHTKIKSDKQTHMQKKQENNKKVFYSKIVFNFNKEDIWRRLWTHKRYNKKQYRYSFIVRFCEKDIFLTYKHRVVVE